MPEQKDKAKPTRGFLGRKVVNPNWEEDFEKMADALGLKEVELPDDFAMAIIPMDLEDEE